MQCGYFDDDAREYVIQTPYTPSPWINYFGCEEFFSLFSHTGGGYCFYRDARLRRILRYRYNDIPLDGNGRYFYLRDQTDGDYWSLGFMPVKRPVDQFECRHGLGYSKIRSLRKGLSAELLAFVPLGQNAEIHHVTLKNHNSTRRCFKLFSFVEFCFWNALDDMTNFQRNLSTGEVEVAGSTVYHMTEYRERRNHFAFYHVHHPLVGFDTQRDAFVGPYHGLHEPLAVIEGRCCNSLASGFAPIASHALEINLEAGETKEITFVLGYVENPADEKWQQPGVANKERAEAIIDAFKHPEQVAISLAALRDHWSEMLSNFQIHTRDARLNRMVNIWNPYQCMATFNLSRSASYYESGIGRGMGFRDCNQDLLGVVHTVPEPSRQRILDIAATQFPDGSAYHQYQPLTKRGNHQIGSGFNDDPLWLILSVCHYVKETGDYDVLEEPVPFDHDTNSKAPLREHLARSFQHVLQRLGPHGLPLIGRADWNDCLNLNCFSSNPDESFQTAGNINGDVAESVMIAGMFVFVGNEYRALLRHLRREEEALAAEKHINRMRAAIIEHAFDGEWFLRAFDAAGKKVGSRDNKEGKIFIESQAFCAMAEVGREQGLSIKALNAVATHLAGRHGIVLQQPAFSRYYPELGEISSYPPGTKENAGVFCHNNPWIMIAESIHQRGDQAYDYYRRITPAFLEEGHDTYRAEPYVYSQMITGADAGNPGQAKNSWLTGTAAWSYVAITQYMLGIRPEHDGLRIQPAIANEIGEYRIVRKCRGAVYDISVVNASADTIPGVYVDGCKIKSDVVPFAPAGERVVIKCAVHLSKDTVNKAPLDQQRSTSTRRFDPAENENHSRLTTSPKNSPTAFT